MLNKLVLGADLASRHGCIVDITGKVYYMYDDGTGLDSSLEQIYSRAEDAALAIPLGCTVVIDWDRTITSWGPNAKTGTLLTLYTWAFGIMCRLLRRASVRYVSPSTVRHCLGLPDKAPKLDCHKAIWHLMPPRLRSNSVHSKKEVREDMRDAWILCFTYDCSSKR
jgi:hypothetical protein